ncbi:MAG: copper homeostasis protein CutC [Muribaculaceae bacterium]|nr:copper homeostasis protein CutC [Muribaculaceae bacterium]
MAIKLEICTGDPEGVLAAIKGGADRVELCSGLAEGGLTPSAAMIRYSAQRIPTNVLIRPRAGDFVYSPDELDVMAEDIRIAVENGAQGIVTGALTPEGEVDVEACRYLLKAAAGLDNTFHRAFDVVANPERALEEIIELGFARVLTSGQSSSAEAGAFKIASLKKQAGKRISIMAGAGVTPKNIASLVMTSRADEIHASARSLRKSELNVSGEAKMGSADSADGSRMATDPEIVAALRKAIDMI